MKNSKMLFISVFAVVLLMTACDRHETPVEKAVENTKDALDLREHEKLKDAAENTKDALDDAVEGIKDETKGE